MWLTNSSIGRKLIMAATGACLVLFVTFHVLMNAVAILWPGAYNQICAFLGANWYALIASAGLGFLFVLHIVYALWLTLQNRKARGNNRYAVTSTPKSVEWSSKNMLVLGIVVLAFLAVHMIQFWYKMQWQEIWGHWYSVDGTTVPAAAGTLFIHLAFQSWWTPVVYIIGFIALWFHMNHGFWSMFQSTGWNNTTWLPRLKKIASAWTTIVIGLFVVQALWFTYETKTGTYLNDSELNDQYLEMYNKEFQKEAMEIQKNAQSQFDPAAQKEIEAAQRKTLRSIKTYAPKAFLKLGIPAEYLEEVEAETEEPAVEAETVSPADSAATEVNQEEPANN